MAKQIVNVHPTGYKNTGEMTVKGTSLTDNVALTMEERFFLGSSLVIYTGTGGSGTALVLDTDYTIGKKSDGLSDTVGLDVYGGIYITNGTYQDVDLYIPDNTLTLYGDYVDASDINGLTQISLVDIEDGETYTPVFNNVQLVGDTTLGDAAITISDGAFLGQTITLSNQGAGFATFTHPDFSYGVVVDPDHNPVIKWVSDGVGGFKWDVGSQVSAEYSIGSQFIRLNTGRGICIREDIATTSTSEGFRTVSLLFGKSMLDASYCVEGVLDNLISGQVFVLGKATRSTASAVFTFYERTGAVASGSVNAIVKVEGYYA